MFRKKLAVLVAAALMTLSASSAFAAFADLNLIRVVYERTTGTVEYGTDLGNINTLLAAPSTTIQTGVTLSASIPNNLYVAYFAIDRNAGGVTNSPDLWVSGSTDITKAPVAVGTLGFNTAKSGSTNVYNYYNSLGSGTVTADQAYTGSYRKSLSASQGAISNAINTTTRPYTEASLASLVNGTATSVTQNLYYFSNANTASSKGVIAGNTGVAQIITNADGSTTINTTATPIPPAFFLMGSGLLGMFGLRRKAKIA